VFYQINQNRNRCNLSKQILYANSKQNKIILKLLLKYHTSDSGIRFNQAIFELTMAVAASTFLKTTEPVDV
jgi:hypothetical protein